MLQKNDQGAKSYAAQQGSTDLLVGHLFEVHSRKKASISLVTKVSIDSVKFGRFNFFYSQFETDNLQLSMPPDQNDKSTADVLRQTMDSHKHLQVGKYLNI